MNSDNSYLLCQSDEVNLGGRAWSSCRQMLYPDRLELQFLTQSYTLPMQKIKRIFSGKDRGVKFLEIVHEDQNAPDTLRLLPLFPAKWFESLESLGIPTEDAEDLRFSKQWSWRTSRWVSLIEGGFWMLVFGMALLAGLVSQLMRWWNG